MTNWNPIDYRIFETISGSTMYGTSIPTSDIDYRGVCIPPLDVIFDPFHGFDQKDSGFEEEDRTIYALGKFMKLCADGNPNIVELLFAPQHCWVCSTAAWDGIIANTKLFLSKKIKFTFSGYAFSQLNAIKTHRKWFIDPPKEKPTRKMFGLTDAPRISGEGLQAVANIAFELLEPTFRDEVKRELDYRNAKIAWDNYISWFNNRNPKRKDLEDKFGYDTKHAMHLFRLMYEGEELLTTGKIVFPLEQREELLAIRNGKYSYEEVIERAENFDKHFDDLYQTSSLPHSADFNGLRDLYSELVY